VDCRCKGTGHLARLKGEAGVVGVWLCAERVLLGIADAEAVFCGLNVAKLDEGASKETQHLDAAIVGGKIAE
jgi:hypothetical protein